MCQIALSQDGQIQYIPINAEQQVVASEDLEAAAHSAVTGMTLHLHTYLAVLFTQKNKNRMFEYYNLLAMFKRIRGDVCLCV